MKINEVRSKEQEVALCEASVKNSFLITWILGTGLGGAFALALVLSGFAGVGMGLTALIGWSIQGAWVGFLLSLFARGERRDIYKKMQRRTNKLLDYIEEQERVFFFETDKETADAIKEEAKDHVMEELKAIDDLQTRLERSLRSGTGDAGIFRKSFRRYLNKQLERGVSLKRTLKQINDRGQEMELNLKKAIPNFSDIEDAGENFAKKHLRGSREYREYVDSIDNE